MFWKALYSFSSVTFFLLFRIFPNLLHRYLIFEKDGNISWCVYLRKICINQTRIINPLCIQRQFEHHKPEKHCHSLNFFMFFSPIRIRIYFCHVATYLWLNTRLSIQKELFFLVFPVSFIPQIIKNLWEVFLMKCDSQIV